MHTNEHEYRSGQSSVFTINDRSYFISSSKLVSHRNRLNEINLTNERTNYYYYTQVTLPTPRLRLSRTELLFSPPPSSSSLRCCPIYSYQMKWELRNEFNMDGIASGAIPHPPYT